jgi:hypothetical protein
LPSLFSTRFAAFWNAVCLAQLKAAFGADVRVFLFSNPNNHGVRRKAWSSPTPMSLRKSHRAIP